MVRGEDGDTDGVGELAVNAVGRESAMGRGEKET